MPWRCRWPPAATARPAARKLRLHDQPRTGEPWNRGVLHRIRQPRLGMKRPWLGSAHAMSRRRGPGSAPSAESTALARQRRNLMFSSSRTEGGARAETRITDLSATDPRPASPTFPPAAKTGDSSPPTFEGAWPASERPRGAEAPPQRRRWPHAVDLYRAGDWSVRNGPARARRT